MIMTYPFKPGLRRCLKLIRAVVKASTVEEHKSSWHVKISAVMELHAYGNAPSRAPSRRGRGPADQFIRRDVRFRGPRYD